MIYTGRMTPETSPTGTQEFSLEQPSIEEFLSGAHDTNALTAAEAVELLAYPDLDNNQAEHEYIVDADNTVAYAQELQRMVGEVGRENVLELAGLVRDAAVNAVKAIGIKPSTHTTQLSWALWDMAKQRVASSDRFLASAGPGYKYRDVVGDALVDPKVRQTIVHRQVGWEVDSQLQLPLTTLYPLTGTGALKNIHAIQRAGTRKGPKNELDSFSLMQIGEESMTAVLQVTDESHIPRPRLITGPLGAYNPDRDRSLALWKEGKEALPGALQAIEDWTPAVSAAS